MCVCVDVDACVARKGRGEKGDKNIKCVQTNKQTNKKQHYKAKRKKSKSWHFWKSNPRLLLFTSNRSLLRQDVASMHVCTQRVGYGINRLWGT